jgi:5-methyltetrahydrofolate--homocysteine methyltransferase
MKITDFIKDNILLLDGATGSLLMKKGFPSGQRSESANISCPELLVEIHKAYYDAGSNSVTTNTFGANFLYYSDEELETIIRIGIENVRKAAELSSGKQQKFIAYDMGPTGKLLKPYGELDFEYAVELFGKQARLAEKYGADYIMIETFNDGYEAKAALLGAKENCSLPVFVSNAYGENDRLLSGADPESMVAMLEGLGADVIGLNCSYGPEALMNVIERILKVASVPVLFKPNAGLPKEVNGETVYDIGPEDFAASVLKAVEKGVNIIGGCCGTAPEYISCLRKCIEGRKPSEVKDKQITVVSSYNHSVEFGEMPVIIGERINPTGKKAVKQALKDNNIDFLIQEGIDQQKCGADILDVNCGLPDINEKEALVNVVSQLQAVCDLPVQIDTSDETAMEAALRIYNGKPVINSVNGKQEVMDKIFPLAEKYGGLIIALTLDENGIPETAAGRFEIAEKIIREAEKYGIKQKNLMFDPLTLTVSADSDAANVTLESVRMIHEKLGCHTVLGVSNVSFGLPQRDKINSVFFTLAMNNGLSAGIINPKSEDMMKAYRSFNALKGIDKSCMSYIASMNGASAVKESNNDLQQDAPDLKRAIIDGRKTLAVNIIKSLIKTEDPLRIINDDVIPALDIVGKNFESKKAFLPELLMSAEAAKGCFDIIKEMFPVSESEKKFTVILATVKGDIHDIGKNIVKLLLENYGYDVVDLGKDVAPETVLAAAEKYHSPLVGLSALMTTTVPSMKETVDLIHSAHPDIKVIVGGAVLTAEYAEKIGADAYAADAMESVRYAEELLKTLEM